MGGCSGLQERAAALAASACPPLAAAASSTATVCHLSARGGLGLLSASRAEAPAVVRASHRASPLHQMLSAASAGTEPRGRTTQQRCDDSTQAYLRVEVGQKQKWVKACNLSAEVAPCLWKSLRPHMKKGVHSVRGSHGSEAPPSHTHVVAFSLALSGVVQDGRESNPLPSVP